MVVEEEGGGRKVEEWREVEEGGRMLDGDGGVEWRKSREKWREVVEEWRKVGEKRSVYIREVEESGREEK